MSLVFFGHFTSIFGPYLYPGTASAKVVDYFAVWEHRGISFFIVITGYFIYGMFLRGQADYREFVKKRLLRICPLYWSVLFVFLGLSLLFPSASKLPSGL